MSVAEVEKKEWHALAITAAPEAAEALEFAFNELDSLGTEIDHLRRTANDDIIVVGYFNERIDDSRIDPVVAEALAIYQLSPSAVRTKEWRIIAETDWLLEWKQHWKPTVVGNFIVSPPWETLNETTKHVILIEPNMAFGTGTHETTQLCLAAIEKHLKLGFSVLDVGTGTGILSIGAALQLRSHRTSAVTTSILACDTDLGSIEIARENAVLNNVGNDIEFFVGSIDEKTTAADLVLANLTIDVIHTLLDELLVKTKRTLIMSGILAEQENEIVTALASRGIDDAEIARSGEWISVTVQRPAVAD